MKIQIVSDLHLNNSGIDTFNVPYLDSDVTILAGDIGVGATHTKWIKNICDEHNMVLYVLGNHEYYGHEYHEVEEFWNDFQYDNFKFLQKDVFEFEGIKFAGCTFWTDFEGGDSSDMNLAGHYMNDYRAIWFNDRALTPQDTFDIHHDHRDWLLKQENIDVLILHHAPTKKSIAPQYADHFLNASFVSDCVDVLKAVNPKLCVHGHCHTAMNYHIDDIEVVCNPRGYPMEPTGWDVNLIREI